MKLPWVSRAMYEALTDALFIRAERAEALAQQERQRADDLLQRLLAVHEPKAPVAPKAADSLMEVIRLRAGSNGAVRRALGAYVKNARAQGVDEGEIQRTITDWPSSDDEGVEG